MYVLLGIFVCGVTWYVAYLIPVVGFVGFFLKGVAAFVISILLLLVSCRDDALLVLGRFRPHAKVER